MAPYLTKWDDPESYDEDHSWFGDGRYPPDWGHRRKLVWERQGGVCARCGRQTNDEIGSEVHHYIPLNEQGTTNSLSNLIGLCSPCHNLMHPEVRDMNGNYKAAPRYPDPNCDDRVAVVRKYWSRNADDHAQLLDDWSFTSEVTYEELDGSSPPDVNSHAINDQVLSLSAADSKKAGKDFPGLLEKHGLTPEASKPYSLHVIPVGPDSYPLNDVTVTVEYTDIYGEFYIHEATSCPGPYNASCSRKDTVVCSIPSNHKGTPLLYPVLDSPSSIAISTPDGEGSQKEHPGKNVTKFTIPRNVQTVTISISGEKCAETVELECTLADYDYSSNRVEAYFGHRTIIAPIQVPLNSTYSRELKFERRLKKPLEIIASLVVIPWGIGRYLVPKIAPLYIVLCVPVLLFMSLAAFLFPGFEAGYPWYAPILEGIVLPVVGVITGDLILMAIGGEALDRARIEA